MSKVALITGITGQDGPYLSKLLLQKGYKIFGLTRTENVLSRKNFLYLGIEKEIEFIEAKELTRENTVSFLRTLKPDEVYNLASQSSVGHSFIDPYSTLEYNIMSVLYWLEGIRNVNSSIKYYQASSSEMFGNVPKEDLPLRESLIFHPASPYGISKAAAHWLAVNYRESSSLFSSCGILFNHESALRGERFVVKKAINTAVRIKLGLYDGKLQLGNLHIERDWGYAPEYVDAMWLMMQQDAPSDYIICSGNVMSLRSLVESVFTQLGLDMHKHIEQNKTLLRPNDLERIYGDNSKAKKELGWKYSLTNQELISKLIEDEIDYITWERAQN